MWRYTNSYVLSRFGDGAPEETPSRRLQLLRGAARFIPLLERYLKRRERRRALLEREIRQRMAGWRDLYLRLVQFNVLYGKEVVAPIAEDEYRHALRAIADMRRLGRAMGGGLGRMVRDLGLAVGSQLHESEQRMRRRSLRRRF